MKGPEQNERMNPKSGNKIQQTEGSNKRSSGSSLTLAMKVRQRGSDFRTHAQLLQRQQVFLLRVQLALLHVVDADIGVVDHRRVAGIVRCLLRRELAPHFLHHLQRFRLRGLQVSARVHAPLRYRQRGVAALAPVRPALPRIDAPVQGLLQTIQQQEERIVTALAEGRHSVGGPTPDADNVRMLEAGEEVRLHRELGRGQPEIIGLRHELRPQVFHGEDLSRALELHAVNFRKRALSEQIPDPQIVSLNQRNVVIRSPLESTSRYELLDFFVDRIGHPTRGAVGRPRLLSLRRVPLLPLMLMLLLRC